MTAPDSKAPPVELAVITNSYNRCDLLKEAMPSILTALRAVDCASMIVVFDAGSTDGSRAYVQELAKATSDVAIILRTPEPVEASSFADGCNQAIACAISESPDLKWCFFFETDNLLVNLRALPQAITLLESQPKLAGSGFTVEKRNGQRAGFGCSFPRFLSLLVGQQVAQRLHLDDMRMDSWQPGPDETRWGFCDVVYTSPLLVRAEAWKKAGPMDAVNFPFTDSDVDLCWQMHQRGWRFAILDVRGVIHDNDSTPSAWSSRRVFLYHQSRLRLLHKHLGGWVLALTPLLFMRHLVEWLILIPRACWSPHARKSLEIRQLLLKTVFHGYETR